MRSQVSKCSSIFSRIANNCCLKLRITDAVMKTSDDGKMFFMYWYDGDGMKWSEMV